MINKVCKWMVFKLIYPLCYFLGSLRSLDSNKYIFVENHDEKLSNNYTLLVEELKKRQCNIHVHYLKIASSSWGIIILRTIKLIWDMANAKVVVLNESNSVFGAFTIRKETRMIQVWHACGAFKKWGYSIADKEFGDDRRDLERYSGHKNYDMVAVSGDAVCWAYEEAFGLHDKPGVVQAIGVSRTDFFFKEQAIKLVSEKMKEYREWIGERKILLYAPTFRGDIKHASSPNEFDWEYLARIREHYVVIIKQHPFVKSAYPIPKSAADFCMEANDTLSIDGLMILSDVCVTDYSSVVFEYSLLKKPILFFAYDLEEYYDERGFYYAYEEFVPGPIVRTTGEVVDCLEHLSRYDIAQLDHFVSVYMNGCDGHATERIVEYMVQ